jgi:hypothetical protein
MKVRLAFNGLHGIISQKIELFKATANKTYDSFEVLTEVNMKSKQVIENSVVSMNL